MSEKGHGSTVTIPREAWEYLLARDDKLKKIEKEQKNAPKKSKRERIE